MKKRILTILLAGIVLAVPCSMALAQDTEMFDDWLTAAFADALGYQSLDDLIAKNGYSTQPKSVKLHVDLGETKSDGGINPVSQEGVMVFLEDTVFVALTDKQMEPLAPLLEAEFPFDYFANLPGPYEAIEVIYQLHGESPTRYPAYAAISTEMAVGTYEDLEAFAGVIDLKDYIRATIDDYVSANIEGFFEGKTVIIDSQFIATGVYTTVYLFPYGY